MKGAISAWWVGAASVAFMAGEVRAQFFPPAGFSSSYSSFGFGFQRRHFAFGGSFGTSSFAYGPYGFFPGGMGYPFAAYGGYRVTIVAPAPVIMFQPVMRRRVIVDEDPDDVTGVDLDLVHPDDLTKSRVELARIMEQARQQAPPRQRIAPPADWPVPQGRKAPPQIKKPPAPKLPNPKPAPQDEYQRLIETGRDAFRQQFYGVAANRFAQAAKLKPGVAEPFFLLSQGQFALGKYADAVRAIQQGMRLHKDWPQARLKSHLDLYKGNDDFSIHLKRLDDAVAAHPKNPAFLFLLGHELWFIDRRAQAAELFRRARPLTADPTFIDAFLRFAPPGPVALK